MVDSPLTVLVRDTLGDRLAPALVIAYQGLVSILFVAMPILAYAWSQGLTLGEYWRETSIGHASLIPLPFYWIPVDSSVSINIFWVSYLIGLVFRFSGLIVYYRNRRSAPARIYTIFAGAAAFAIAGVFDQLTSQRLTFLWISAVALVGGALIHLAFTFPEEIHLKRRLPHLSWAAYTPALILPFIPGMTGNPLAATRLHSFTVGASVAIALLGSLVFILVMFWRRSASLSPLDRQISADAFVGATASLAPALLIGVCGTTYSKDFALPFAFLPLIIFPLTVSYALLRHRSRRTDALLIKAAAYTLTATIAAAAYFLLLSGLSLIAGGRLPANQPLLILLFMFVLVLAFDPVYKAVQMRIARAFGRRADSFQAEIQAFSQELTHLLEPNTILASLVSRVNYSFAPSPAHVFVYDTSSSQYAAAAILGSSPSSDLLFQENNPLVNALSGGARPLHLSSMEELPTDLKYEWNRITMLGSSLFIPLPGQKRLVGWLALGAKSTGEPYNPQDIDFLAALCDQAALAIERSQVIENLECRIREMDVLTRVAQGVNITPELDDILELIYAQTIQVIPSGDFRITLTYPSGEGAYHAFYLEGDDRLSEKENLQISTRLGLETLVIKSQRSLIIDDYERECRNRGVHPDQPGIYAWMGVPLNAGAQTIGVISLGSRDVSRRYTDQQRGLLQAIADQAAGAITKSRLLEESKKHVRQLATLNEVSRSLTSTLEIKPLLSQILHDACAILNCEAGVLALVDESTHELVFETIYGPLAENLPGSRFPPETGLISKVVGSGEPLISNNIEEALEVFEQSVVLEPADHGAAFNARDLIAVPMIFKQDIIGVIAGINKRDGSPFNPDDLELLVTLSSQAAIAIENARLYTQTDEALNARLEEMSVMQRIDRELNTSLEVNRTMQLTLDWALAQSQAEAGLIGFVEEGENDGDRFLRVVAEKSTVEMGSHPPKSVSNKKNNQSNDWIELESVQIALQTGLPQRVDTTQTGASGDFCTVWEGSITQVVIPVRRKSDVIGILLLERTQPGCFTNEIVTFLTRLCDHSAIAVSNALLYADLQAANIAKSEFVSLVSHELKTPMTSIRGYTDLLAQGTVGPVNEIQSNFLNTIRSNVNRMANLVSDLADISRIEAGRLHLEFQSIAIEDVLQEVVRSIQGQLDEKEHTLEVQIPDGIPDVWADLNRLIQILNNLISNAIKYTPQNGLLSVQVEHTSNQWDPDGAPQVIHISVNDNGLGISKSDQEKVFQKFFRSSDQNIRDLPGTGLGLNITRHLVEMQGGRIWFESEAGYGSAFHFTVPVAMTE